MEINKTTVVEKSKGKYGGALENDTEPQQNRMTRQTPTQNIPSSKKKKKKKKQTDSSTSSSSKNVRGG